MDYILLLLLLGIFLCYPVPPDGGPKDEIPPAVDSVGTTPNFQTNFEKQRIELTFNEWVKLDDVFNQVVVSPPLEKRPTLTIKGKTVRVDFDEEEVLRDSATYTINFGEAVQDLTESNPAENLRFVFSTGDFLDSLEMSGRIIDALTNEPIEDVLFMLYDNLADSVPRTELPFYFAKTDKGGRFTIRNIKTGTFKGFALQNDFGYLFDQANEKIGFPDTFLLINDSIRNNVEIRLFQESPSLQVKDTDNRTYGLLKVTFNKRPYNLDLIYELNDQTVIYEFEQDTLKLWYDQPIPEKWKLILRKDTLLEDTVSIQALDRETFLKEASLKCLTLTDVQKPIKLNPGKDIELKYNHPIQSFDPALIRLFEDTTRNKVEPEIIVDSSAFRRLKVRYPWKEGLSYELEIMPDALTDFFGIQNKDTLIQNYDIELLKKLGIIDLTVKNLSPDTAYVIELIAGEKTVKDTIQVYGQSEIQRRFENLEPGKFSVQIITDTNRNGRWDTGSYDEKRQPEPIFKREIEPLRANWEVQAEVSLGILAPTEEEEAEKGPPEDRK